MELKRVSFKVAKAIKDAGYPQDVYNRGFNYTKKGSLIWVYDTETYETLDDVICCVCPLVMEVWLWLWREKHIAVEADYSCANDDWFDGGICGRKFNDPEEAIIAAIEHLADNDLIK